MTRASRPTLLLLTLLVILPGGCLRDPVTGERFAFRWRYSATEAARIAEAVAPNLEARHGGRLLEPVVDQLAGELGRTMQPHAVESGWEWELRMLDTSLPAAFAVPGGVVYLSRGLVASLTSRAELVFLLGHLVGHLEHRHLEQGEHRDELLDAASGESIPAVDEVLGYLVPEPGKERQADERGRFYCRALGLEPPEPRPPSPDGRTCGRHPPLPPFTGVPDDHLFPGLAAAELLRGLLPDLRARLEAAITAGREPEVRQAVAQLARLAAEYERTYLEPPGDVLTALGIGLQYLRDGAAAEAVLSKAISLGSPDYSGWEAQLQLGQLYLRTDRLRRARQHLTRATRLFPWHPAGWLYLGETLERLEGREAATNAYRQVLQVAGRDDWYHREARLRLGR